MGSTPRPRRDDARLLLDALRALVRSQTISERADSACCGMTLAQAAVIHVLLLEGPMRMGPLGRRLGIAPSTLTRNAEPIERAGLIRRAADPHDGRAQVLCLTAAGERAAREIERNNLRFSRQVLEALPPARRRRAVDGLVDLLGAIDTVAGPCCPDAFLPVRDFVRATKRRAPGRKTAAAHGSKHGPTA